jgi:protease I
MLATNGYEDSELTEPRRALVDSGVAVVLAAPDRRPIAGTVYDADAGMTRASSLSLDPDLTLGEVRENDYDALVLPGGVTNPDTLRLNADAVRIVRHFMDSGKVVAAICHAPWLLVEADVLRGRRVTGWYSIRTDMTNAGAEVLDQPVVVDGNLITSRMPGDLPAFNAALLSALAEIRH